MEKLYSTQEVAEGFNCTTRNINKHSKKLTENVDYIMRNCGSSRYTSRKLTETGIRKLATMINTQQAQSFVRSLAVQDYQHSSIANANSIAQLIQQNTEALKYLQGQNAMLEKEVVRLSTRKIEVKTQKEYKWQKEEKLKELGTKINYFVNILFYNGDYKKAHDEAKSVYRMSTGHALPHRAYLMTVEQKEDYLQFLLDLKQNREDEIKSMPEPTEADYMLA